MAPLEPKLFKEQFNTIVDDVCKAQVGARTVGPLEIFLERKEIWMTSHFKLGRLCMIWRKRKRTGKNK
jgi:hypothetical protein